MPLFIIFIVVPLIELMLLIEVGSIIGTGWTFLIIIATAIIGTKLVKQQGVSTWANIQKEMASGQLPAQSLFDGICILISGVLLITPGFMTDVLGLSLLTPAFRAVAYKELGSKIKVKTMGPSGFSHSQNFEQDIDRDPFKKDFKPHQHNPDVIDGDYERKD